MKKSIITVLFLISAFPLCAGRVHDEARHGNWPLVQALLKEGESLFSMDDDENNVVHLVAAYGSYATLVWLADYAQDNWKPLLATKNKKGKTPIDMIDRKLYPRAYMLLSLNGRDKNVALLVKAAQKNVRAVKTLLSMGADPALVLPKGSSALHGVAYSGDEACAEKLIEATMDRKESIDPLDSDQRTPLLLAARQGNSTVARVFMQHGARLDAVDQEGNTALHWFARSGDDKNIDCFVKQTILSKSLMAIGLQNEFGETAQDLLDKNDEHAASLVLLDLYTNE